MENRGSGGANANKQQGGNRPKSTLKFENDYDFEQANNKFEELRSQISKLKVGDEVKPDEKVASFLCFLLFFAHSIN